MSAEQVDADTAHRMARIASLSFHPSEHLAAMLVDTEARVAALELERLDAEVEQLRREPDPDTVRALLRFSDLLGSLDAVIAAGRRGELSMAGLVPVTALVELLDAARQSGEPITDAQPYRRASTGPDPEDPPAPPDGAR